MGDLECGFEEMLGVKLGYLLIKGKQMFALSQVFTDLLKNIPRTTVHKRMDHLNVKKHHCDLEELRKLKAIHSIAFHAAKCTLISREDVEALYISCKTERVLKSNKRKVKACSPGDAHKGLLHADTQTGLWKDKVWFSLHTVPQTLSLQNNAGNRELPLIPDAKLPQFYKKPHGRDCHLVPKSYYKPSKNYETAQIPGNCVAFNPRASFFKSAVNRQPVVFQSAIAAESKLSASDLLHKRKRRRDGGGGRDGARHSWSRSRHTHHPPVLLVQPKCCSKPKPSATGTTLETFHLGPNFYLNPRAHEHLQHHPPIFHESYSSDTESSIYSDGENNDSDFGSNCSTSSNSGSSDEEEDDDSQSESSEVSSEDESSSQSDSSSVSSQVSVQSIRFRRARVSSVTKTFNTKTPLVLQPTFHYNHHQQSLKQQNLGHDVATVGDYSGYEKHQKVNLTFTETRRLVGPLQPPKFILTDVRESFLAESKSENMLEICGDPKRTDPVDVTFYALGTTRKNVSSQRRAPGHAGKYQSGLGSHCDYDKGNGFFQSKDFTLGGLKSTNHPKQTSPLKIKTEKEDSSVPAGHISDSSRAVKTPSFNLQNVKVKVEESNDEYEYCSQVPGFQCREDRANGNNGPYPSGNIKQGDCFSNSTRAIENTSETPKSPCRSQECRTTQDTPYTEEGDYKNGARVRKNFRTLVLGRKNRVPRTQTKQSASQINKGLSSRPAGKSDSCETYTEHLPGPSKRKRPISNVASPSKKTFSFMANFPSPPALIVGSDGDLCPAYSMNSLRNPRPPPLSHPVWRWQPGGQPLPPPPVQRIRKC